MLSTHPNWLEAIPPLTRDAYKLVGIEVLGYDVGNRQIVLGWGNGCTPGDLDDIRDGYRGYVLVWRIEPASPAEAWHKPLDDIAARYARVMAKG